MAHPFDLDRLELTGEAFPVAEGVNLGPRGAFSVSTNGTLAYLGARSTPESQLGWFDRTGKQLGLVGPRGEYERVHLSSDDRLIAFDQALDVFLFDIERRLISRLTSNAAADFAPVWSADGRRIAAFASSREPAGNAGPRNVIAGNLYERAVGVVGNDQLLFKSDAGKTPTDWSSDGRHLAYISRSDIWALALPVTGDPRPLRVTDTPFAETSARFSPDGRWIAFQSNESGPRQDVYIQSFPEPGAKQQVSAAGGILPRWRLDGKELFYIAPNLTLMSVSLEPTGTGLQVGTPVLLFQSSVRDYEVSSDGRFLMNVAVEQTAAPLTVVLNWAAGLKK